MRSLAAVPPAPVFTWEHRLTHHLAPRLRLLDRSGPQARCPERPCQSMAGRPGLAPASSGLQAPDDWRSSTRRAWRSPQAPTVARGAPTPRSVGPSCRRAGTHLHRERLTRATSADSPRCVVVRAKASGLNGGRRSAGVPLTFAAPGGPRRCSSAIPAPEEAPAAQRCRFPALAPPAPRTAASTRAPSTHPRRCC